jgi:hypothetical protein
MTTRDILLNRIWEDLKQADIDRHYAIEIIDVQTRRGKWYNMFIALCSGGGVVLSFVNENFPLYASAVVLVAVILNQFMSHLFYNSDYCAKLCQTHTDCYRYEHVLHDLYMKYHSADIDDKTAEKQYRQINESHAAVHTETSQVFGKINKKAEKAAQARSQSYLEAIYYSE